MLDRYLELLTELRSFIFDFKKYSIDKKLDKYSDYKFINALDTYWVEHLSFLNRFYIDDKPRNIIMGLNGGKDGFNKTSVAFTDPTAARGILQMNLASDPNREPSSEKLYPIF